MSSFFVSKFGRFCYKTILGFLLVISLVFCFSFCVKPASVCFAEASNSASPLKSLINWLFPSKTEEKSEDINSQIMCYVGGFPLGFTLNCEGVLVVATSDVLTHLGSESTFSTSSILPGDVLYSLNGKVVYSAQEIEEIVNLKDNINKPVKAKIFPSSIS